jgi:hypothetical protein
LKPTTAARLLLALRKSRAKKMMMKMKTTTRSLRGKIGFSNL